MRKFRGKIRMSKEFLEQLLGLPEEVAVVTFQYDPEREILTTVLASDSEVKGYTFDIGETQTIPDASDEETQIGLDMEAVRRTVDLGKQSLNLVEKLLGEEEI